MSLPSSQSLQNAIVRLLRAQPAQRMHCSAVYTALAAVYPALSHDEVAYKYRNSISKFANEVQWARQRLCDTGLLIPPHLAGRGYWQLSTGGSAMWPKAPISADDLLREIAEAE